MFRGGWAACACQGALPGFPWGCGRAESSAAPHSSLTRHIRSYVIRTRTGGRPVGMTLGTP